MSELATVTIANTPVAAQQAPATTTATPLAATATPSSAPSPTEPSATATSLSTPTPTIAVSPSASPTAVDPVAFEPGDANRQMEMPYPPPETCPVSPTSYGRRAGYPAFWTQGIGVWGGLTTMYAGDNRVMWVTDGPRQVAIDAISLDAEDATFHVEFTQVMDRPSSYPSALTFSDSGCWQITVTAGSDSQEIIVYAFPEQYLPRLIVDQFISMTVVEHPANLDEPSPGDGETFFAMTFLIENALGDRAVTPWDVIASLALEDSDGVRYPLADATRIDGGAMAEPLEAQVLAPGESLHARTIFIIPSSPLGMSLMLTGSDGSVTTVPITHIPDSP